jgi:hypothetical protein
LIVIVLSGSARATPPDFNTDHFCSDNTDHFCSDFAQRNAGNMPGMAKAVCMMSEKSNKAVIVAPWDHAPAAATSAPSRQAIPTSP